MGTAPWYEPIREDGPSHMSTATPTDITSTTGPMTSHDEAFIRSLQEQEARGKLTGGLGQGFRPPTRLNDADLLSSAPTPSLQRSLTRTFTGRRLNRVPSRVESILHAGQEAANRRGEVIEVVMEETPDISSILGPNTTASASGEMRQSTFAPVAPITQVFYPQPNWKPFSMRWPYLILLISLSFALAVMQEVLFRVYKDKALITFNQSDDGRPGVYFALKFPPTIAAVVFGVLWQFTDFEVRRLEAFYQLSKQGGALASESINVDYIGSINLLRPITAFRARHYAVLTSSIATILSISLVPTFAAASVILTKSDGVNGEDLRELHFSPVWSRLLTSTLVVCALAGMGLFYLLQTRRSGLLADVRGIAGLASMAVVSHILMDFKDLDRAKPSAIHHRLKHHRYVLRNSSLAPDDEKPVTVQERDRHEGASRISENPHPLPLRAIGSVPFIIGTIAFIGFIPLFLFTQVGEVINKAPWAVTFLAVSLKLAWTAMEQAVRMIEPFYILSRRHAPSKTLTLDYTALPFGYMPLQAFVNGHFLVFLVGTGTVMAEVMVVMVTGLATVDGNDFWRSGGITANGHNKQTIISYYIAGCMSVFILAYMAVVATIVFFRRRHPFLPRQPTTIASILAFIHQSKMLYDFVGTEKFSVAQMRAKLDDGKTYGLGWFEGRDGQTHCGVDREDLISDYKHGIDFSQGINPWNTRWDTLY